jgi:hypothetical protein
MVTSVPINMYLDDLMTLRFEERARHLSGVRHHSDLDVLIVEAANFLCRSRLSQASRLHTLGCGGHMAKKSSRRELINTGADDRHVRATRRAS